MIASLLLAVQLVAPASVLTVRAPDRESQLPLLEQGGTAFVRADLLVLALDGQVHHARGARWQVTLADATLEVTDRVPFVSRGADTLQLVTSPFVRDAHLYLPLQLLAEALPRFTTGLLYDAERREVRRFSAVANGAGADRSPASTAEPVTPRSAARPVATPASAPSSRKAARQRVVVVDAGHGGRDRGMRGPIGKGPRIAEADITLQVARRFAAVLRDRGYKVVMTRTSDTLIALYDRGPIANRSKGDLFVSIHVNAANPRWRNPGAARGFETYFLAEAKTEDERRVEQMENEAVRFEADVETTAADPLSFIVNDMAQNEHLRESSEVAATVQRHLRRIHPGPNRGVKQAGFVVLIGAFMPAVLVEIGFGTNPTEARFLSDAARQRDIARALADATDEYFSEYERRLGAAGS